jgi:hypothetical protein
MPSTKLRRESSSRNRRRRRRGDEAATRNGQRVGSNNDDIVDQLRRQRQKQDTERALSAQQFQRQTSSVPAQDAPKNRLGKFEYCEHCCSYFPRGEHAHSVESNTAPQSSNGVPPRCRLPPFHNLFLLSDDAARKRPYSSSVVDFALAVGTFLGYNARSRQVFVERWRYQLWAKSARNVVGCVKPSPRTDDWYSDDSVPSNRSFDVIPGRDSESFPTFVSCQAESRCILANRVRVRDVECQDQRAIHTIRRLRKASQADEDSVWFGMVVSHVLSSETGLKWYCLSPSSNRGDQLPLTAKAGEIWSPGTQHSARWNDFCSSRDGRRMIIVGESKSSRGGGRGPWLSEFVPEQDRYTEALFRPEAVSIHPSNLVCVESFDDHSYVFGHADGILTLWDDRTRIDRRSSMDTHMLKVIRLLPQQAHRILVRGGGTVRRFDGQWQETPPLCQLWDVRYMSRVVHSFVLPPNQCHEVATFRSNGMATDPGQTVLFSPWIERSDEYQFPRLGVWGMHSGEYLGSKALDEPTRSSADVSRRRNSQVVVEFSECVTPGWEASATRKQTTGRSTTRSSRSPGSVGLWYRIHERYDDKKKSSSIGHLLYDGKWD